MLPKQNQIHGSPKNPAICPIDRTIEPTEHPVPSMATTLPLPKYHQVYLVLREQLAEGCYAGGVPAEMRLVEQFGVARVTVRKALERLAHEGLIARAPGRGTVALRPRPAPASTDAARPRELERAQRFTHASGRRRTRARSFVAAV